MKLTLNETDKLFCMILDAKSDEDAITIEIVDGRLYAAMADDKLSFIAGEPPVLPDSTV